MIFKRFFLQKGIIRKADYRRLQLAGEYDLKKAIDNRASEFTATILPSLRIRELRAKKEKNLKHLVALLEDKELSFKPFFRDWPPGAVPLNLVLECTTATVRERLSAYLKDRRVFSAIHWALQVPQDRQAFLDPKALDLSGRLLTLPVDFRYGDRDLKQISDMLLHFSRSRGSLSAPHAL
jgi:hypothetical protein